MNDKTQDKVSIVIMAHPSRAEFIPYLKERLGNVEVIFDEKNNVWDTCRRAWLAVDQSCEYGIIIQDDAIVCNNFRERAEEILTDEYIYSFYAGALMSNHILRADRDGKNYVISDTIFNEIALCMKTKHIDEMVKFCDDREAQTDQEIMKWAQSKGIKIFYTLPSLIDHRDTESIYKKNYNKPFTTKVRKAFRFINDNDKK